VSLSTSNFSKTFCFLSFSLQITPVHYFGALAMVLDRDDSYDPANAETTDSILFLLSLTLPE